MAEEIEDMESDMASAMDWQTSKHSTTILFDHFSIQFAQLINTLIKPKNIFTFDFKFKFKFFIKFTNSFLFSSNLTLTISKTIPCIVKQYQVGSAWQRKVCMHNTKSTKCFLIHNLQQLIIFYFTLFYVQQFSKQSV